ncbi:hypothetical protein RISK_004935 [Rhodopirellula islandica]|uniref:Uncharacterized protein n=1 Tax=Rhodopirellula islandica TaxID=595434 RepID=A0A0J1B819_RHOIS|nr:hypothetical protein [Rhodopirellula islandica]KLU02965.1 hypothetical protein RISK_004935 [Rhodopirellula islandica]
MKNEAQQAAEKLTDNLVSLLLHMEETSRSIASKADDPGEIRNTYLKAEFALSHWVATVKQELRKLGESTPEPLRRKHDFPAHRRLRRDPK